MHGHGWRPRRLAIAASVALGALAGPPPGIAAESVETLPGVTISAVGADLDDDGARELVRIIEAGPNATAVDVWRHAPEGWLDGGSAPLVSPDEIGNDTLADQALGAGALLVTRREGRDRVLALTAQGIPGDQYGRICCLALAEIRLRGERDIVLEPLIAAGLDQSAAEVQAVDLDGDGTDELATMAVDVDASGAWLASRLGVLAWVDGAFVPLGEVAGQPDVYGAMAGDTNGVAGNDLHLGITEHGSLKRVALVNGELVVEESHIDMGESGGWIGGIADGAMLISSPAGAETVRWPAGGEPRQVGRLPTSPYAWITVVGTGSDALLVRQDDGFGGPPTLTVYDRDLRLLGDVDAAASRDLWYALNGSTGAFATDRFVYPYAGPLPDGSFGARAAFASFGVAVVQDGDGGFETRAVSELAGLAPIGVVGPDDAWLAVGEGLIGPAGATAYISPGALQAFGPGRVVVGPVEAFLSAASPASAVSIELRGEVVTVPDDDGERLLVGPSGFEAVVTAPPGSLVIRGGPSTQDFEVADLPVRVEIRPVARRDRNYNFRASVMVFTPEGRATLVDMSGTFVREPPELDVSAATETFSLATRIRGAASPGTTVSIRDRPIEVDTEGAFDLVVDAAIWPEDVVVTARDPLGNETARRLQVVGFIDYRGLPWLPMVGLVTLAVGAVAYARAPRVHTARRPVRDGDATFEEIDAD